jgi:1-acyl-sn-glycerol-3-phosphate acyltransferase
MRRWLGGIAFLFLFNIGSAALALAMLPSLLGTEDSVRRGARRWARWYVWCGRIFCGVYPVVRGTVPQRDAIVAFKHQSAYETILALALFDWPAVVMKAELRRIPVWGLLAARHGSIFVDRAHGPAALRGLLRQARARAAAHRPIIIFPEGTRIPAGQCGEIRPGLFALASATGLPVIPVALDAGRRWVRGPFKRPGPITLAFQPAIAGGLTREAFDRAVTEAINAEPLTAPVAARA